VVTGIRLLLLPVFVTLLVVGHLHLALLVLVLIGVSDFLDGFLARQFDQATSLGAKLDPIADRLAMVVTSFAFAVTGLIPWWLVAALLVPDIILVILVWGSEPPPTNLLGKVRTALLLLGFPLLLAGHAWGLQVLIIIASVALLLGTIGHLISAVRYGVIIVKARRGASTR